ncbi:uncharacterized protein LOC129590060 [Paramacrobiotus metropolitanus]|uniref:uncharacterized protein LOC129590060 n=1 Tax=Paramacrobiotus metropolitanus TaxID=2943436 RepID=UPI0024459234|nr:uncharacterized protein LOC129590060 [Paramacrobiotus metropolitanus]
MPSQPFTCSGCGKELRGWGNHKNACPKTLSSTLEHVPIASTGPSSSQSAGVPSQSSSETVINLLKKARSTGKINKGIPRAARALAAETFARAIEQCVKEPTIVNWTSLLLFASQCFATDGEVSSKKKETLTGRFRRQLLDFESGVRSSPCSTPASRTRGGNQSTDDAEHLRRMVESYINECSVHKAVARLASEESVLKIDAQVLSVLHSKHPDAPIDTVFPSPSAIDIPAFTPVTTAEVISAVFSFPSGSAGGLDGLRPQHIKDMLSCKDAVESPLRIALCKLVNFIVAGKLPEELRPALFGANLTALSKKDGGVRPIAVGNVLRRLAAKIVAKRCGKKAMELFTPVQVGCGTRGGAEGAVHAVRSFISEGIVGLRVLFKIDFRNAFNTVRRDVMLQSVLEHFPEYYPFVLSAYGASSVLSCSGSDENVASATGIQQGDPLGPLLFCLVPLLFCISLSSKLRVFFLDDGALGGTVEEVADDLTAIIAASSAAGLQLNPAKCEMLLIGGSAAEREVAKNRLHSIAPGAIVLQPETVTFLGAPLTNEAMKHSLQQKTASLKIFTERLKLLNAHHGFYLLRNCLSIPKLMYTLRCSPCWKAPELLDDFDRHVKDALEEITNTKLDGLVYTQAMLPVAKGGLGVRRAKALAPSAFLASMHSTRQLTFRIFNGNSEQLVNDACENWKLESECEELPLDLARVHQFVWDNAVIQKDVDVLWNNVGDDKRAEARLRAVSTKYAGAWLNALPAKVFGNFLDDQTFRISVGLWLGAKIVEQHSCARCGKEVAENGYHGLACKKCIGRRERHNGINDIILRALCNAGIESYPEPIDFLRENGKRPDGATRWKWYRGQPLVWDVTCRDTMADSYIDAPSKCAGAAAELACREKIGKYKSLTDRCNFVAFACETFGTWCETGIVTLKEIGKKLFLRTGESRSTCFLFQRLSLEIMRG